MKVADTIRRKLTEALQPTQLHVEDDSHRHAGHVGARPEGETHFSVTAVSSVFVGMSRIDRQRRVYQILQDELRGPVHALALNLKAPGEAS
jgi:BolA protein